MDTETAQEGIKATWYAVNKKARELFPGADVYVRAPKRAYAELFYSLAAQGVHVNVTEIADLNDDGSAVTVVRSSCESFGFVADQAPYTVIAVPYIPSVA
jgi:hypothetical protein